MKHIEQCDRDNIGDDNNENTEYKEYKANQIKLWFEFPETNVGQFARIKCKPYGLSKLHEFSNDSLKWK